MSTTEFINTYAPMAVDSTANVNLLPSVVLAMAAIESGWNTNNLSTNYNNFFSIKAYTNPRGNAITYADDDTSHEPFRVYTSPQASFDDLVNFLYIDNQRYLSAGLENAQTPADQLKTIMAAGYATSTYTDLALNIINSHSLTDFDEVKKKNTTTDKIILDRKHKTALIWGVILLSIFALIIILICLQ